MGGIIIILIIIYFIASSFPYTNLQENARDFIDNIEEPIEIIDIDFFRDGGTISLKIIDSKDDYFNITLDGRLTVKERNLYLNAFYPTDEGAIKVPISSNEEKEILRIIKGWHEDNLEYQGKVFLEEFIELLEMRNS